MEGFKAQIDVQAAPPVKPHLGFQLVHIWNRAVFFPVVHIGAVGEEHFFVTEVTAGICFTEGFADEFWDLKIAKARVGCLKNTGFQDDVRVDFVKVVHGAADGFVPCLLAAFRDPGHIGTAHIFDAAVLDHIQALLPIGGVREVHGIEETQSHGSGEIITQDRFADLAVEGEIEALVCRMSRHSGTLLFSFILQEETRKVKAWKEGLYS